MIVTLNGQILKFTALNLFGKYINAQRALKLENFKSSGILTYRMKLLKIQ